MASLVIISFSGPEQKTPAEQGNWKIFINEDLAKSRYWPNGLSHTCDDEKNIYTVRSDEYYIMGFETLTDLSKLLTLNGFENVGNLLQPRFQPTTKEVPRYVRDPKSVPVNYSSDEDNTGA
jgi:hypothetical protein